MRQRDVQTAMNISAASLLPLLQALLNSKRVEMYHLQRPSPSVAAVEAQRAQSLANADPSNKSLAAAAKEAHEAARNATLPAEIFYKCVSAEKAQQLSDLTPDDQVVLQIIERHGNAGVWVRAIKQTSRFNQPQVTKIIKRLEGRRLIKAVKSVVYKWRKMYMLFDLEPAKQITGGPWYTDQTLDTEYIVGLRKVVLEILEKKNGVPVEAVDVASYISKGKISTITLTPRDIVVILDSLVYDGLCDYADGSLVRQQSLRFASMALFPGSGTSLHVGRNEATLAACVAEPKTHEEIERELTERDYVSGDLNDVGVDGGGEGEGAVSRRMGVARALLVQSQEAKTRGRVILLKRGGAPESMIGLGGGFVRRAQLSSMLSASLTLEDKVTKDEIDGEEVNEKGVSRTASKLNTVAINSKANLKQKSRKRRIDDSSDDSEEDGEDNDANDSDDSEEVKMEEGGGGEVEEGGEGGIVVNADEDEGISEDDASSAVARGASKGKRATSRIAYEEKEAIDDGDGGDSDEKLAESDEDDDDEEEFKTDDNVKRDGRKCSSKSNHPKSRGSHTGLPTSADASKHVNDELVSHREYVLVKGGRGGAVDHVTLTPCGVCPVASKCEPGGLISPTSCIYISQWMEF